MVTWWLPSVTWLTVYSVYQSPISAVFPIVRFTGDQKTALTEESLYFLKKNNERSINMRGMSIFYEKSTNLNPFFQALNLLVLEPTWQKDARSHTVNTVNKSAIVKEQNVTITQRKIPTIQVILYPAKFDNFKDENISDYKTVSVAQSKNLLEWKLPGLTNYMQLLRAGFYIFLGAKHFFNFFLNIVASALKIYIKGS